MYTTMVCCLTTFTRWLRPSRTTTVKKGIWSEHLQSCCILHQSHSERQLCKLPIHTRAHKPVTLVHHLPKRRFYLANCQSVKLAKCPTVRSYLHTSLSWDQQAHLNSNVAPNTQVSCHRHIKLCQAGSPTFDICLVKKCIQVNESRFSSFIPYIIPRLFVLRIFN